MILKKPYAFLIKYFKLIHFILAVMLGYIVYKYMNIYNFFVYYINNNYVIGNTSTLSHTYLSFFLYFGIIISIIAALSIAILLRHKKKPFLIYCLMIVYYIILFIFLLYISSVLNSFTNSLLASATARALRDIILLLSFPQYVFIIICFVRTVGFDIKKFDFASDKKELNLSSSDNEEFEFNINVDGYTTKRKVRKLFRELGYYIKENLLIIISIMVVILLIIGIIIYKNAHGNYDKVYSQNTPFIFNNVEYNFLDSIITPFDYKGNIIKQGYHYLVINVDAKNISSKSIKINYATFKINLNGQKILPIPTMSKKFIDYVSSDSITNINSNRNRNIVLVYEIADKDLNNSYNIELYNGNVYDKGEYIDKIIKLKIKPLLIEKKDDIKYELNDNINLKNTNLKNTNIIINNALIENSYTYEYEICKKEECQKYKDRITTPVASNNQMLVIINMNAEIDNSTDYGKKYTSMQEFANNFIGIKYIINEVEYNESKNITPSNAKDFIVLQVSDKIMDSEEKYITIKISNHSYLIPISN